MNDVVTCCTSGEEYLREYRNDPYYEDRNVRLDVMLPGTQLRGNVLVQFCPWCGVSFKKGLAEQGWGAEGT